MKLKIGVVQLCSGKNQDENFHRAEKLMEKAVLDGAQLLALPEHFSFMAEGDEKLPFAESIPNGKSYQFLQAFAKKHQIAIVGGSIPVKSADNSKVKNTLPVIDQNGQLIAQYDKIHLFKIDYDKSNTHDESQFVEAGNQVVTTTTLDLKIGLSICYDLRFPELFRRLALAGVDLIFVPAAFTVPTGKAHWEILLRARAIENQCYIVAAAQIGNNYSNRITYGKSMVIDPWGQILAQCPDREAVIVCEIDLDYLKEVRKKLPALKDIRHQLFFS